MTGHSYKAVIRWLGELGIEHAPRRHRARGIVPPWVTVVRMPDGSKLWCRLYRAWANMGSRTRSKTPRYWKSWGSKGVKVCPEWSEYAPFRAWSLAHGFRKGMSLDRIDNDGHYSPENCRWIPRGDQMHNKGNSIRLTLNGVTKSLPVWARELGVSQALLMGRYQNGWTDEQTLTLPKGENRPGMKRGRKRRVI